MSDRKLYIAAIVCASYFLDQLMTAIIIPLIPYVILDRETLNRTQSGLQLLNNRTEETHIPTNVPEFGLAEETAKFSTKNSVQISVLFGIRGVILCVFCYPTGLLIDRVNGLVILGIGMVIEVVAILTYALCSTYAMLCVARIIQSSASTLLSTSGLSLLSHTFSQTYRRSKYIGIAYMFLFAGECVAPPYSSTLYQFIGLAGTFLILMPCYLCVMLAAAILFYTTVRKSKRAIRREAQLLDKAELCLTTEMQDSSVSPRRALTLRRLLCDPYIAILFFGIVASNLTRNVTTPILAVWMYVRFDVDKWQQGVVWAPAILCSLIGTAVTIVACRHHSRHRWAFASVGLLLHAIACAVFPLCPTWHAVIGPLGLVFFGLAILDVATLPLMGQIIAHRYRTAHGPASGLTYTAFSTSMLVGYFSAAPLMQLIGYRLLNFILCAFLGSFSLTFAILRKYC